MMSAFALIAPKDLVWSIGGAGQLLLGQRQRLLRAVKKEWQNLRDKRFEAVITGSRVHLSGEKCGHNSCGLLKPGISGSVLEDSLRIGSRAQAKHLTVYEHQFAH